MHPVTIRPLCTKHAGQGGKKLSRPLDHSRGLFMALCIWQGERLPAFGLSARLGGSRKHAPDWQACGEGSCDRPPTPSPPRFSPAQHAVRTALGCTALTPVCTSPAACAGKKTHPKLLVGIVRGDRVNLWTVPFIRCRLGWGNYRRTDFPHTSVQHMQLL